MNSSDGDPRDLSAALTAAESWWREAGVGWSYADQAQGWLVAREPESPPLPTSPVKTGATAAAEEAPLRLGGDPARWPATLSELPDWWLAEPTFAAVGEGRRVAPRGRHGAALMVLVDQPEADDHDRLLSGRAGQLLAAILRALGTAEDDSYVASVIPAHAGLVDWPLLKHSGMREVLDHHVRLAAPRRLLVFGRDIASSLLENGLAHDSPRSPGLSHDSAEVPMIVLPALEGLLERPIRKARVWQALLEWMEP